MLSKNTFHLIVISDDYDPSHDDDELKSGHQQELSKYFGLILSFSILRKTFRSRTSHGV